MAQQAALAPTTMIMRITERPISVSRLPELDLGAPALIVGAVSGMDDGTVVR